MIGTVEAKAVPLADLVDPVQTWNPSRAAPTEVFSYIDLTSVDESKTISASRIVKCVEAPSRARQLVKQNDVLVSTVRPNLNGVARVPGDLDGATASTGFCVLRPRASSLDPSYLFHWVKSPVFVSEMSKRATGASYPAVSDAVVHESRIPLPPLSEQRRIAAILDRADELRAKRRAVCHEMRSLKQSIFAEMFGDPETNVHRWPTKRLMEICLSISDVDHKMPEAVENGVPFISAKDLLEDGGLSFERVKMISDEDFSRLSRKSKPERDDIIYSRYGTVGRARLVDTDRRFLASYSCCTIKPDRDVVDSKFLCFLLDSPFVARQARREIRAIAVPDLGIKNIKNFRVIVPPMPLQRSFRLQVSKVAAIEAVQTSSLETVNHLFAALQHRAFAGTL